MINQVRELETALKEKQSTKARNLVCELARNKAPILIHEPDIILTTSRIIFVYIETFAVKHDTPYIFKVTESTKLEELKDELSNVADINIDHQNWFYKITPLTNDDKPVMDFVINPPEIINFHVYVTKKAFLDSRGKVPKIAAWTCNECGHVNHANYTACMACNKIRENC